MYVCNNSKNISANEKEMGGKTNVSFSLVLSHKGQRKVCTTSTGAYSDWFLGSEVAFGTD